VIPQNTAPLIVSLMALGMSLAFALADRRSPISRTLAAFLATLGGSIALNVLVASPMHARGEIPAWHGVFALPEALGFFLAAEWMLRVRRTVPAGKMLTRAGDNMLRVAQALAILYGLLALALPQLHYTEFSNVFRDTSDFLHPVFLLFALPLGLALLLIIGSGILLLNRKPDKAEALRGIAFLIGAPFMASGMLLPVGLAPMATAIGLMIFLVGAVQYHVTQGRRAQFMARFLSPQVADMVRRRGLKSATDEQTLELSVVCCDLRGFTAFSAATSSKRVIQILREYYDMVGAAAAEIGGTIKDQAGDGVLILVGAPITFDDHARRAIEMTERWSDHELKLGVGVGVASGYVTVGVIGSASRLEYTAVGPAVNMASRLCSEASHGEVLVDQHTVELLEASEHRAHLSTGESLQLKGFPLPVQSYVLAAA
jgi:adenylate cyclase